MRYVPVCRAITTAVHSTVVFCRLRTSRPEVPGTRHDTTRVSSSTPNENVDLVLDFISSFSSRSCPPVRKCTDSCGMNMSTNMALKTRTRCCPFDQYVRKGNDRQVLNMINNNCILFPRVVSTELLLQCEKSCPLQQKEQGLAAAVPGLGSTNAKLHCSCCWCCSPMLLLLSFGLRSHT